MTTTPHNPTSGTKLGHADERIAKLAELFPGCISTTTDELGGQRQTVNLQHIRELLAGFVADEAPERYHLDWPGKRASLRLADKPTAATFRKCPDESVNHDTTNNLFIEGDNLDALKLLIPTHRDAVKLIYIDPPYNTGRDFVYSDTRVESQADYLARTQQVSETGEPLVTNPESAGRFHAQWLSLLLPRLVLARKLLRHDGAIAVSVDDNEVGRLTCLLDEVFGKDNRIVDFVWETKAGAKGVPPKKMVTQNHEYVLVYARDASAFRFKGRPRDLSAFANPDNDPRGPWKKDNMKSTVTTGKEFSITDPATDRSFRARWAFNEDSVAQMIKEGRVIFPDTDTGWPMQKSYLNEYQNKTIPLLSLLGSGFGGTAAGAKDIAATLGSRDLFSYPKPVKLLAYLVSQIATEPGDLVMDFFAGSGTLGEAVMNASAEDQIARRFVLVQLPEPLDINKPIHAAAAKFCDELGKPRTIAEIAKERIRRAGESVAPNLDTGFRVLKLTEETQDQ